MNIAMYATILNNPNLTFAFPSIAHIKNTKFIKNLNTIKLHNIQANTNMLSPT